MAQQIEGKFRVSKTTTLKWKQVETNGTKIKIYEHRNKRAYYTTDVIMSK